MSDRKVIFAYASETGMGASLSEEVYAVVCDELIDLGMLKLL